MLAPDRVRAQLREQRGGADAIFDAKGNRIGGTRLLAVVTLNSNKSGRQYRVASGRDYEPAWNAQQMVAKLAKEKLPNGISVIPDEPLPPQGTLGFRVQLYGMTQWGDLFTARQKLALTILTRAVRQFPEAQGRTQVAMLVSKLADYGNSLCRWRASSECADALFGRQAIPIVWDFAEPSSMAGAAGSWESMVDRAAGGIANGYVGNGSAIVQLADATDHPLPEASAAIWFTDPPYYDAVPYADLSDFFFVWLKRGLVDHAILRNPFEPDSLLTPKAQEIVQDDTKLVESEPKDRKFFELAMARSFSVGRLLLKDDGVGSIVFAHKTTEGWEALLSGMVNGGWVVTASWPIATEMGGRLRARESAALATSVHLVCRPRPEDAEMGDWGEVFRELPNRIGDWMERLSSEGVRGADLVFACIGPAMEAYSRYRRVEDAEGREIPLGGDPEATEPYKRGFLAYVWEIVGRTALGQILGTAEARARNGAAGALEEDARLTALFLWTIESTASNGSGTDETADADETAADENDEGGGSTRSKKGLTLVYDVARRFAQPLGIHLDKWNNRIITTEKGIVRLLPVTERAEQLMGDDGAAGVADIIERTGGSGATNYEFGFMRDADKRPVAAKGKGRRRGKSAKDEPPSAPEQATTLDRVHLAMLLQKSGQSNALRTMLKSEVERGPDFLRLANALSALYPRDSEEKRLLDAMLLATPR